MPIVRNEAKRKMLQGEMALGFQVYHLRSIATPLLAAASGYDFLFVDMEHGAFSMQEAMWGGRPVIVSPLPGTRWLGGDAVDYAHTPAEIAAAMESLLDDDVARSRRTASAAQVRSLITPEAPWDHLFELYEASYGHR